MEQGGQQRYFSYDSLSRLIRARNPEHDINSSLQLPLADPLTNHNQWSISYSYDDNGNLTQKVDPRSVVTTYDPYDELNRVTRWANAGGPAEARSTSEVSFVYDTCGDFSLGRRCSVSSKDANGAFFSSTSYLNYRPLGAVGKSVQTVRHQQTDYSYNLEYDYNLLGGLRWQKYPSNKKVVTEFDDAGRTAAVKRDDGSPTPHYYVGAAAGSANAARRIDYAPHGAIRRMGLGNGLWDETRFNVRLQPKQIGLGQTSTDPASDLTPLGSNRLLLGYGYADGSQTANNGNLRSQSIEIGTSRLDQTYIYDALNRLETATETSAGPGWSQTYSYDRFGNRAVTAGSQHGPNPSWIPAALSHFDPGTNRLLGPSEYDLAGNLTKDNVGRQFKYDADNKQVELNPGAGLPVTKYFYDGEGRRVKKETIGSSTTLFVYNAEGQLAAEYSSGSATGSGTSYLTTDHLGSTRVVTDEIGNPKTRHDYLPFGEEIPLTATNYGNRLSIPGYTASPIDGPNQKFTSKEKDAESFLDYFGARYFSGAQGRFTSPDAAVPELTNPQTLNKYRYALNNPLRYVDPDGHEAEESFLDQAVRSMGALFDSFVNLFADSNREDDATPNAGPLPDGQKLVRESFETLQTGTEVLSDVITAIDPVGGSSVVRAGIDKSDKVDGAGAIIAAGVQAIGGKGLGNPFKGKTAQKIEGMFTKKGFQSRGPDPLSGKGGYVNPKTGRSYHIDPGAKYKKGTEKPHVDVNRPKRSKLPKKKYPLEDQP